MIIVMGVSGSGKTTIGTQLADSLHWKFYDADDFMPQANIDQMKQGIPLTDEERYGWLNSLHQLIETNIQSGQSCVLACSALKESYREILVADTRDVHVVYLRGSYQLIQERMENRKKHFMPVSLLESQFETLEEPKNALVVDIAQSPDQIVREICKGLGI